MAVITSTSDAPAPPALSRSAARCSTPKRCCSSITTTPRLRNDTTSWMRAWVPTSRSTSPEASPSSTRWRSFPVDAVGEQLDRERPLVEERRPLVASPPGHRGAAACWRGAAQPRLGRCHERALVPALHSREQPGDRDHRLPRHPTSPCSRRCIGTGRARSAVSSAITFCWSPVSSKGSRSRNRSTSTPRGDVLDALAGLLDPALLEHEHHLDAQQLVEHEAPARFLRFAHRLGPVDPRGARRSGR